MLRIDAIELVRAIIDMVLRAPAIYREVRKYCVESIRGLL